MVMIVTAAHTNYKVKVGQSQWRAGCLAVDACVENGAHVLTTCQQLVRVCSVGHVGVIAPLACHAQYACTEPNCGNGGRMLNGVKVMLQLGT